MHPVRSSLFAVMAPIKPQQSAGWLITKTRQYLGSWSHGTTCENDSFQTVHKYTAKIFLLNESL